MLLCSAFSIAAESSEGNEEDKGGDGVQRLEAKMDALSAELAEVKKLLMQLELQVRAAAVAGAVAEQ